MNIHVWNDTENEQSFLLFSRNVLFSCSPFLLFFFRDHREYLEKEFKFRDALFFVIILPGKCKHWDEKQKKKVWRIAIFIEKECVPAKLSSFFFGKD